MDRVLPSGEADSGQDRGYACDRQTNHMLVVEVELLYPYSETHPSQVYIGFTFEGCII